ncbi:hypothetical protein ACFPH6_51270, partial [Streptomyces xiangluensis]
HAPRSKIISRPRSTFDTRPSGEVCGHGVLAPLSKSGLRTDPDWGACRSTAVRASATPAHESM